MENLIKNLEANTTMDFDIIIHPQQRVAYIPKKLYEILGTDVKALPNTKAVIFYNSKTTHEELIASVKMLLVMLEQIQIIRGKTK